MKKKILSAILLLIFMLSFAAIACSGTPEGKFVADDYEVTTTKDNKTVSGKIFEVSDATINEKIPEEARLGLAQLALATLEFKGDELTVKMGELSSQTVKFKIDGKQINLLDENGENKDLDNNSLTFERGKVVMMVEQEGIKIKIYFKKV